MTYLFRVLAKALGMKASSNERLANHVAWVRIGIAIIYLITNVVIIAGVVRHWGDR